MSSASPLPPSGDSRRKRLSRSAQQRKAAFPRQTRRAQGGRTSTAGIQSETSEGGGGGGGGVSGTRNELGLREADDEAEEGAQQKCWPFFRVFVEKKYLRQFFG